MKVLFTGTYNRTGKETGSVYEIAQKTSDINFSAMVQVWNFTLLNQPTDYVYYFGFFTQRIDSYEIPPPQPTNSILNEQVFLTITQNKTVIGSLNSTTVYPDNGTETISSRGFADYTAFTASGVLSKVKRVRITFMEDLNRKVEFYGCGP
jgi:hypothetical protein